MRLDTVLRWIARVWGIASSTLILAFMFGGAESMRPTSSEALGLLFFPVGVIAGFAIAWRREGLGGLVTIGSFALFWMWLFLRGHMPGPYFFLFAAPGFLHAANALLCRRRRTPDQAKALPTMPAA